MGTIELTKGGSEPPNILHLVWIVMFWRVDFIGASMSCVDPSTRVAGVDADIPHSTEFFKGPGLVGIFVFFNIH